jgi:hypothetical protein
MAPVASSATAVVMPAWDKSSPRRNTPLRYHLTVPPDTVQTLIGTLKFFERLRHAATV